MKRPPTIIEVKKILDELESEAENHGRESYVGQTCIRAHDLVYALARAILDAPR